MRGKGFPEGSVDRLRLGTMFDGGIWSVRLDDKLIEHLARVDLYSAVPKGREVRLGMVDLAAGEHTISFECKGRSPAAQSSSLALDVPTIDHLTPYCAAEEMK